MDNLYIKSFDSDLGPITVTASEIGIRSIAFSGTTEEQNPTRMVWYCIEQLKEYFNKEREVFDLPLDLEGHTPFHIMVWRTLLTIPFANTASYMDIAKQLNNPKAIRAVGRANGANPIPIVIPCHRVIGSDGSLTGYSGGLEIKKRLLVLENPGIGYQSLLF